MTGLVTGMVTRPGGRSWRKNAFMVRCAIPHASVFVYEVILFEDVLIVNDVSGCLVLGS